MRIAIRTTCGRAIGLGHLRRCLTLAEELLRQGAAPLLLISGDETGPQLAAQAGIAAEAIVPREEALAERLTALAPALLIVDDYALSGEQLASLHAMVPLAVIDDLADRVLDADLVQNGNANAIDLAYRAAPDCRLLLGPSYSLLRPAFRGLGVRSVASQVERVLVMMGGSDARGLTSLVTRLCLRLLPCAAVDVVLGPLATAGIVVDDARVTVHRSPSNLVALMTAADVAVSAGGQTNYELAAAGLPAVSVCVADNQRGNLTALANLPTLLAVFDPEEEAIAAALQRLANDHDLRHKMSHAGQRLVDGMGTARVAEELQKLPREKVGNG